MSLHAMLVLALASAPPSADPEREPPPGTGLFATGAFFTGALVVARSALTVIAAQSAACVPDPNTGDGCEDNDMVIGFTMLGADGITAASAIPLGLLGAGLERRGRWLARRDLALGNRPREHLRRRQIAGWSMLGSGVAVWLTTSLVSWYRCESDACFMAVHEGGFYAGAALVGAGVGLAPIAKGYADELRRAKSRVRTISPFVSQGTMGLSLSGRF